MDNQTITTKCPWCSFPNNKTVLEGASLYFDKCGFCGGLFSVSKRQTKWTPTKVVAADKRIFITVNLNNGR